MGLPLYFLCLTGNQLQTGYCRRGSAKPLVWQDTPALLKRVQFGKLYQQLHISFASLNSVKITGHIHAHVAHRKNFSQVTRRAISHALATAGQVNIGKRRRNYHTAHVQLILFSYPVVERALSLTFAFRAPVKLFKPLEGSISDQLPQILRGL